MLPVWTHHLKDPEDKRKFRAYVYSSKGIVDRQLDILKGWEAELDSQETDLNAYDSPSWAARQADNNGYRRCLKKMKQLLTLDQKETQ